MIRNIKIFIYRFILEKICELLVSSSDESDRDNDIRGYYKVMYNSAKSELYCSSKFLFDCYMFKQYLKSNNIDVEYAKALIKNYEVDGD